MVRPNLTLLPIAAAMILGCGSDRDGAVMPASQGMTSSSMPSCQPTSDQIFTDCLSENWQMAVYDGFEQATFIDAGNALPNTFFQTLDSGESQYGQVVGVEYFQVTGYSQFQFNPSSPPADSTDDFTSVDLSAYQNGVLAFDLRILDYGMSELGLFVTMQCGWPCRSRYFPVANKTGINGNGLGIFPLLIDDRDWWHIEIPLAYFLADNGDPSAPNLDITAINTIIFAPAWSSDTELQGFHFQIDNIEFIP